MTISTPTGQQQPIQNAPKKVLCIEDEHFIGELYTRALQKAGYAVDVVADGAAGLKAAQTDAYDIILLDIMVPTMLGTDVLTALRDPAKTPKLHAKILITTNLEQSEENRAAIEKQADGYIVKAEITPRQLVEFIKQLNI